MMLKKMIVVIVNNNFSYKGKLKIKDNLFVKKTYPQFVILQSVNT